MFLTRRDLSLETQGIWVSSFDWISYSKVYVVLVCENPYDLIIWVRVVIVTCVCFGKFS